MNPILDDVMDALKRRLAADAGALAGVEAEAEALAAAAPGDAWLRVLLGGVFDASGFEEEACVWYERGLELGLEAMPEDQAPHFGVWYGSTLRNVGRLAESEAVLREAAARWPRFAALRFFLGLTLMSQGRGAEAFAALASLHVGAWDSSLEGYQRAVASYLAEEVEPQAALPTLSVARLLVADVAVSAGWYRGFLGVEPAQEEAGFALFRWGCSQLELVLADGKNPRSPGGTIAYWSVPALEPWLERAQALGGTLFRGPLVLQAERVVICQILDPQGDVLGLRAPQPSL